MLFNAATGARAVVPRMILAGVWLAGGGLAVAQPSTLTPDEGRPPLRANSLGQEVIKVDGRLDEAVYGRYQPVSDFIQQEPDEGAPATEKTEAWVFFDEKNIYVSARCFDSQPDRMVANELRRDSTNLYDNEHLALILDTFQDRRNGYLFSTTPLGALFDGLVTDEAPTNRDWNTVWEARSARDEKGWTVEFAIPFKSLRYGPVGPWGINLRRRVRWKNEVSFLSPVPASFARRGLNKVSSAATLIGIEPPKSSRAFEMKPYTTAGLKTDAALEDPNSWNGDLGLDAKLTLSSALAVDFTYNTDFAQVEDDVQQVNLSRFSLVFPEKRDFFLEGQGLFSLGTRGTGTNPGGGGGSIIGARAVEIPILFFSRRIGLSTSGLVPITGGARLMGKAGEWSFGALQMRTGADPALKADNSDFSILRVKRNLLKQSTLGVIATRRGDAGATDADLVYGGDLNLGFGSTVRITGIGARNDSGPGSTNDRYYQTRFEWLADRYGIEVDRYRVEQNFNPGVGFVPRPDIERTLLTARIAPRPTRAIFGSVRRFRWLVSVENIAIPSTGAFSSREFEGRFETEFQNGDFVNIQATRRREDVETPFKVAGGLVVPVGSYRFNDFEVRYRMGQQRRIAGALVLQRGGFYGGTRTSFEYSTGRVELSSRLSIEPQIQINRLDTPFGKATPKLVSARVNWTLSPRTVLSGLSQYNSTTNQLTTNIRFRWEYQPGSDLYVVYGDARDTLSDSRLPAVTTRNLLVKFTRLFRF